MAPRTDPVAVKRAHSVAELVLMFLGSFAAYSMLWGWAIMLVQGAASSGWHIGYRQAVFPFGIVATVGQGLWQGRTA